MNTPGASSTTVTVMLVAVEPPELLAQTMYVWVPLVNSSGVPQIVPLLSPKLRPTIPSPLIHHSVMAPPDTDGTLGVIV